MEIKDDETPATSNPSTTPPIAPTEPAPIPIPPPHMERDEEEMLDNLDDEMEEQSPIMPGAPKYYCPMHCEGDKLYDQPGSCPVCGMHLVELKTGL